MFCFFLFFFHIGLKCSINYFVLYIYIYIVCNLALHCEVGTDQQIFSFIDVLAKGNLCESLVDVLHQLGMLSISTNFSLLPMPME